MTIASQTYICVQLPRHKSQSTIKRQAGLLRRAWLSLMAPRHTRLSESQLTALDGLNAETLKDIGAPEWLQAQAYRSHERAHQGGLFERDSLHWR